MDSSPESQQFRSHEERTHKHSTRHSDLLVIEREFAVPVAHLYRAFSTPDAIKAWWWPKDLYTDRVDLDFRAGGSYFINMKGEAPQGGKGMTGRFEVVDVNKKIVMTDSFADENGNSISASEAKMPGEWPETAYITFEFEEITENTSRLILSQEGIPNELQKDCIQGWNESFDKLKNYLEKI